MADVKLNLGAGDSALPGFVPLDIKSGVDVRALPESTPDGVGLTNVAEIRASHVIEHLNYRDAKEALAHWAERLRPGGVLRAAVPDADKILAAKRTGDPRWYFYLFGGQTDEHDQHLSGWSEDMLSAAMSEAGLVDIQPWSDDMHDMASHSVSLRLEGRKPAEDVQAASQQAIKIAACMSIPRFGPLTARGVIEAALHPFGIPLHTYQGVFWGQCMQRAFEQYLDDGVDWILTLDFDSLVTKHDIDRLFGIFGSRTDIDALAPLQCRRGKPFPLATAEGKASLALSNTEPVRITTAHFGCTLIRVDALRDVPKPWFKSQPDDDGGWGDGRMDDDIWFWHQWREAGRTLYLAPSVPIGHLEEMAAVFDPETLEPRHVYVGDWRKLKQQETAS